METLEAHIRVEYYFKHIVFTNYVVPHFTYLGPGPVYCKYTCPRLSDGSIMTCSPPLAMVNVLLRLASSAWHICGFMYVYTVCVPYQGKFVAEKL